MPVDTVTRHEDSHVTTKFQEMPSAQPYIMAFVISDFTYQMDLTGSVPQRVFGQPEQIKNGDAQYAVDVSWKILKGFEDHLGVNYTLPKMDQIAIPDFAAGAMENWVRENPKKNLRFSKGRGEGNRILNWNNRIFRLSRNSRINFLHF